MGLKSNFNACTQTWWVFLFLDILYKYYVTDYDKLIVLSLENI